MAINKNNKRLKSHPAYKNTPARYIGPVEIKFIEIENIVN
jgi:hypothetical protein